MDARDHSEPARRARDGGRRSRISGGVGGDGEARDPVRLPLRNSAAMLSHVGKELAWQHRMAEVSDQLEQRLSCLDRSDWLLVKGLPLRDVGPVPFTVFGPAGVFVLQASRGHWLDQDIALMSRAGEALGAVIRDYPDPVRPCIVILDGSTQERQHFAGPAYRGAGPCWIVSDGRLMPWLLRFRDHGFSPGDVACLRMLADPARIRETDRNVVPAGEGHDGIRPEDLYFPG